MVEMVGPVTSHSWIGQTVQLTCAADGSPTPTLSWKRPSGRVIQQETELKITVDVPMRSDRDFGNYTCEATNDVNTDTSTVQVQQISKLNIFCFVVYKYLWFCDFVVCVMVASISSILNMHQGAWALSSWTIFWDKNALSMGKKNTTITLFIRGISRLSKPTLSSVLKQGVYVPWGCLAGKNPYH